MTHASVSVVTSPKPVLSPEGSLSSDRPSDSETWRERFLAALPLLVVGSACVATAVYLFFSGAATTVGGNGSVHLRPWVLFIALGITGLSAGIIALFGEETTSVAGPDERGAARGSTTGSPAPKSSRAFARPRTGYPGPTSEELPTFAAAGEMGSPSAAGVSAARAAPVPSRPPVSARVWDESDLPLTPRSSASMDSWDESSEEFVAAASQPAPPETVLHQLDELEQSLRKKPASPHPK